MNKEFRLFLLENADRGGRPADSELFLRRAASLYGVSEQALQAARICRSQAGKPYFDNLDIYFSVSHTDGLWACLMGPVNCGLDIQVIKPCNYLKIAGRFFSAAENAYVRSQGLEGFFALWTRREAAGKYSGRGFFADLPELVQDGCPAAAVCLPGGGELAFIDLDLSAGQQKVSGTVCLPAANRRDWHEAYFFI